MLYQYRVLFVCSLLSWW